MQIIAKFSSSFTCLKTFDAFLDNYNLIFYIINHDLNKFLKLFK